MLRNPVFLTRLFFLLIATLAGYWVGRGYTPSRGTEASGIAFFCALLLILVEFSTGGVSSRKILVAIGGLFVGLLFSILIYPTIPSSVFGDVDLAVGQTKARILCNLAFGYLGIILALKHANYLSFARMNFVMASPNESAKILDTSVIVDGRIKELIAVGFMQGNFIVPEFVLDELQKIADSADPKRRSRGRRGLDMLEKIKEAAPRLAIMDKDYPEVRDVDHKLISLAKETGGALVTNDFNLQKVAQFHQVHVLNINELSNMLKPTAYVGESVTVFINKEGKEATQGIGYLEDGTMVVVEDGRSRVGTQTEVTVTSILQTPAGRMVFARVQDSGAAPASLAKNDTPSRRATPPKGGPVEDVEQKKSARAGSQSEGRGSRNNFG
jgi:uncharacterized protein YacL